MKPAAVVLVLSLGILSGGAPARADSPWQSAEPLLVPAALGDSEQSGHWTGPWPQRPHIVPDGAYLWSDYRGACIEHDLYHPRFLASPDGEHQRRPLLWAVGDWLDSLFAWPPLSRHDDCPNCNTTGSVNGGAGMLPPAAGPDTSLGPRPLPLLTPVPAPEDEPRPRVQPAPVPPTPVQVVPVEPGPTPPPVQPPINEIPKPAPPRGSIVELAPEPAIPAEQPPPATTIPRNRVPRPGQQVPRNVIPR
jgi:hypothetical protein